MSTYIRFEHLVGRAHLLSSFFLLHLSTQRKREHWSHFDKRQSAPKQVVPTPPATPFAPPPAPSPSPPPPAPPSPPPKEALHITPHFIPFLHTLSEPQQQKSPLLIEDLQKKLQELGVPLRTTPLPQSLPPRWKESVPEYAFVCQTSIQPFLQKVEQAMQTRLGKKTFLGDFSLDAASLLLAYASTNFLKAIIVAYDVSALAKAQEWLGLFPSLTEQTRDLPPLHSTRTLFSIPIYELSLPSHDEPSAFFKANLWKVLQTL